MLTPDVDRRSDNHSHDDRPTLPAAAIGYNVTTNWEGAIAATAAANVTASAADEALQRIHSLIGKLDDEKHVAQAPQAPASPTPPPPPAAAASPTPSTTVRHEDEALQNYMDQFLERITGKKKELDPQSAAAVAIAAETAAAAAEAAAEAEKPREIKRPPESALDLSKMREVANHSARQALGLHDGRRLAGNVRQTFLIALILSLMSSLLAAVTLLVGSSWTWILALSILPLALFMTWRFRGQCRQLRQLGDDSPARAAA
jgi:hypothetical protein